VANPAQELQSLPEAMAAAMVLKVAAAEHRRLMF